MVLLTSKKNLASILLSLHKSVLSSLYYLQLISKFRINILLVYEIPLRLS